MKRLLVALLAGLVLLVPGCNDDSKSFDDHGVSFTYPGSWERIEPRTSRIAEATSMWSTALGTDDDNHMNIGAYRFIVPVTEENIEQLTEPIAERVAARIARDSGEIVDGPQRTDVGGLPGLIFDLSLPRVSSEITLAFNGTTEYIFECESSPEETMEMRRSCDRLLSSFKIAP